jgi:4-amino-4-deoxy-L-arabinose transferase-like glycosyltransferase
MIFHHIPKGDTHEFGFEYTLYSNFVAVINYDSPEFLKDSVQPVELLEKTSLRQSRPGLILLVAGLNQLVPARLRDDIVHLFRAAGKEIPKDEIVPYVLYVLLNYLFLFLSFFLFLRMLYLDERSPVFGSIFLSSLFVFNDVTKAFLLTPHTQIFNILAPLVCLYGFLQVKDHDLFNKWQIYLFAFLVGLGVTAYGTFVLFIPSVFIALVWVVLRDKKKINLRIALGFCLLVFLTMLPFLVWVLYVYHLNGSFFQFEIVQYQQFVWIFPLLRTAPWSAFLKLVRNVGLVTSAAAIQAAFLPVVIFAVCLVSLDRNHRFLQQLARVRRFPVSALIISGLFLLFFALAGLPIARVAFSAVPPLVFGSAVVVNEMLKEASPIRNRVGSALVVLLLLLACWNVVMTLRPFG